MPEDTGQDRQCWKEWQGYSPEISKERTGTKAEGGGWDMGKGLVLGSGE